MRLTHIINLRATFIIFDRQGTVEETAVVELKAGEPVEIVIQYNTARGPMEGELDRSQPALMRGLVRIIITAYILKLIREPMYHISASEDAPKLTENKACKTPQNWPPNRMLLLLSLV